MDQQVVSFNKKYLPYIVLTLLFFLLTFLLKNIQFKERKTTFSQKMREVYKDIPTVEIAQFDEGEGWRGNMTLDSERTFDGSTGMNIFSTDGKANTLTLTKSLNLSPYRIIYAYIYVPSEEMVKSIDSLLIQFNGKDTKTSAPITTLQKGWNQVAIAKTSFDMPQFPWDKITSVSLILKSKSGKTAQIAFDRLWAQLPINNLNIFSQYSKTFMTLKTTLKSTYLFLASPQTEKTIFKKTVKNDFDYAVGLAPIKFGTLSLVFQANKDTDLGYYFEVSGKNMDSWQIFKMVKGKQTILSKGTLKSNIFEKEAYVWIQIEKRGDKMVASYSFNSQLYTPIGEASDNEFIRGSLGLVTQGAYLIDTLEVKE